jgi:arsenate reductase-like glutaredoxin family protein
MKVRAPSKGELTRFAQKFGVEALVDRDSKRFAALGLAAAHYGAERWLQLLLEEPFILRMPLVRLGNLLSLGPAEDTWREWTDR